MQRKLLITKKLARNISLGAILMAVPTIGSAFTFTTCGATGPEGPLQAACDTAYTGTDLEGLVTVAAGIQSWTVPATGLYRIETQGAQGASGDVDFVGGLGAQIIGEYSLTAGSVIQVVVGQQGIGQSSGSNGGGGGGSFVVDSSDTPIQVAGGGGGTRNFVSQNGCDASITEFGIIGSGSSETSACTVKAVALGLGGAVSSSWGSSGAGFNGDGADDSTYGFGGSSWANGMSGGDASLPSFGNQAHGGFGGGGTGNGGYGGGGGGGYSGGDGGRVAGGGGSYNTGANPVATAAVSSGDGTVIIDLLSATATNVAPIPTLSQWAQGLLILLLLASAVLLRKKSSIS
ncbi:hypothetical protein GCM10009133_02390 [Cocleimonas flava]|uniref:Secreted protein (IPTL-CTERM system target) n=1 Tax=Cocleimonas flava TaxID=634765 RepID=A0A4R1EWQ5_9GAMM|nr:glycine-rich protein [Cocleimonas flava]TCJ85210.1 hypothetical protein EV695_3177 [Cocleimonas flava]